MFLTVLVRLDLRRHCAGVVRRAADGGRQQISTPEGRTERCLVRIWPVIRGQRGLEGKPAAAGQ